MTTCLGRIAAALCAVLVAASWLPAHAAYPDRPIRMIVPFPAGGSADFMARGMGQRLGVELRQQVLIENRGGAGGIPAAEAVAKASADGYTLLFATMGTLTINPALYAKLPYDPLRDFTPISITHLAPRVLVVHGTLAAKSVAELIALARTRPGALSYGSAGNGSSSHLAGALFASMAGVELLHVPYKGSAPLLTDMLAGRIDMTFDAFTIYEEHIRSGRLRALAVTSKNRLSALPNVPTLAESGLKGYDVSNWLGVLGPAGLPADIGATLHAALGRVLAAPALRTQLTALGVEPTFSTPAEFTALMRAELPKWAELVKKSGAKAD
jgi:tripartite-type tricarboxylate transporter receptor subunit TctC